VTEAVVIDKIQEEQETTVMDHASPAGAAPNPSGSQELCPTLPHPPLLGISSGGILSLPSNTTTMLDLQSGATEVSQQWEKTGLGRIAYSKPSTTQTKARAAKVKAAKGGASKEESNPYSIEGAMDGLLEVGGEVVAQSPKGHRKTTNTST
jgi:hypothetical protein